MKQTINLGVAVDTGTGDYLRRGGTKINENFNELYTKLGDGQEVQPSNLGIIYHKVSEDGPSLNAKLGQIYAIDTSSGPCTVQMPIMSSVDVGKSITFIDPFGTWNLNNVKFIAAANSSFGTVTEIDATLRYSKLVMTFSNPANWLFDLGQRLDQFSDVAEASRYVRYRKVDIDGQTDFTNIFPVKYNDSAIDVIVNGVDLYYGNSLSAESEFGSIDSGSADIVQLDGYTIRLKHPAMKGDIIKFVTYMKSTGTSPTSVEQHDVLLVDTTSAETEKLGEIIKLDLSGDYVDITLQDMGAASTDELNTDASIVYVNGVRLVRRGDSGLVKGSCSLSEYDDEDSCNTAGGIWTDSWEEYDLILDGSNKLNTIRISTSVLDVSAIGKNYITVQTYNYILGTITDLETIVSETDLRYMRTSEPVTRTKKIAYSDIAQPNNQTAQLVPGTETIRFDNYNKLLETIYPIGSLYFNAHNSNNPSDYMGFGTWVRYAQGRAIVGWDNRTDPLGKYDPDFGLNNNDLDILGQPKPSAGGTVGSKTASITVANLPVQSVVGKWLKKAADLTGFFKNYGDLGGSNVNPLSSYNEETISAGAESPTPINNIQPSITVYCWVRVQ